MAESKDERGELRREVDASIAAMGWLVDADKGTVALARVYADRIDEALETGAGVEVTKALYLGPHLLGTLRALGGTPEGRLLARGTPGGGNGKQHGDEAPEERPAVPSIAGGKRPQRPPKRA